MGRRGGPGPLAPSLRARRRVARRSLGGFGLSQLGGEVFKVELVLGRVALLAFAAEELAFQILYLLMLDKHRLLEFVDFFSQLLVLIFQDGGSLSVESKETTILSN